MKMKKYIVTEDFLTVLMRDDMSAVFRYKGIDIFRKQALEYMNVDGHIQEYIEPKKQSYSKQLKYELDGIKKKIETIEVRSIGNSESLMDTIDSLLDTAKRVVDEDGVREIIKEELNK